MRENPGDLERFDQQATSEIRTASPRARPMWGEWVVLLVILGFAAWLRLWRLDLNGTGNPYYAAAVRSMQVNFKNFVFGSFDPAGFITVDKPPLALWVQAISAKVFGFHGLSLLIPQAIMGVASVVVLYVVIRRTAGVVPALLAAFVLSITPIGVAVDRDNLPDSMLTLVLLLAAAALSRAIETGRWKSILTAVALVGVGFNVKMLAAFLVLPTFYLVYFLAAPVGRLHRLGQLSVGTAVLMAVSLSWCLIVEFVPKQNRPYIGGSKNNSALDLALGYNGLGRVFGGSGNLRPPGGRGGPPGGMRLPVTDGPSSASSEDSPKAPDETRDHHPGIPSNANDFRPPFDLIEPARQPPGLADDDRFPGGPPGFGPPGFGPPNGRFGPPGLGGPFPGGRGFPPMFGGIPGLLRFTRPIIAEQIMWLFPVAVLGAVTTLLQVGLRGPMTPLKSSVLLWSGWLGTHWVVFSFAQGIFHEYYTIVMGPAVAALVGIGAIPLWQTLSSTGWKFSLLPTALLANACWQVSLIGQHPEFRYSLMPLVLSLVCLAVTIIVMHRSLANRWPQVAWGSLGATLGLTALAIGPTIWSIGTALVPVMAVMPTADVSAITGVTGNRPPMLPFETSPEATSKLLTFLKAQRQGEKYLVAANSSMEVSSLIIQSGEPAISLGGFMGADPVLSIDQFKTLVHQQQLRFVLIGGGPGGGPPPGMAFGDGNPARQGGFDGLPGADGGPPPGPPGGGPMGMGNSEIMTWVREHGELVETKLWKSEELSPGGLDRSPGMPGPMRGARQLYDLRPAAGVATNDR